jgi:peptidyl-prolyl cis-trans isomerase B (cyclophilin B)
MGLCPEGVRNDRKLGDKTILCTDPQPLGRLALDLYGNAAPGTVAAFKALVASGALNGTCISKIIPGQWLVLGRQGPKRSGLLEAPPGLPPNPDMVSPSAFRLRHSRPGTLSLNLSENEDEPYIRDARGYRNLSFLITTGPGLAYSLDGENIVFGAVADGMDVVSRIAQDVPVFMPDGNLRAFNDLANFIGDERAAKSKAKWSQPLQAVVIVGSGTL